MVRVVHLTYYQAELQAEVVIFCSTRAFIKKNVNCELYYKV